MGLVTLMTEPLVEEIPSRNLPGAAPLVSAQMRARKPLPASLKCAK